MHHPSPSISAFLYPNLYLRASDNYDTIHIHHGSIIPAQNTAPMEAASARPFIDDCP